ncbi:MAG: phytase, partial [Cyanobacteria bacterium J06631_2]
DTADFSDNASGNLRVDYVLPSTDLSITEAGVFWTTEDDELFRLVGDFDADSEFPNGFPASDRRLVYADVNLMGSITNSDRQTLNNIEFLGEVSFTTGFTFAETEVGGISGLAYDQVNNVYYALSDDRSTINDARYYDLAIALDDGSLNQEDVEFTEVTILLNAGGNSFAASSLDPEGIALTDEGTIFISSEGDANNLVNPFIAEFTLDGQIIDELPIPDKFLPSADGTVGIRSNQAFESLTITPDGTQLFTATENALLQDGETSTLDAGSPVRIIQYDLDTKETVGEFLYETDPIPVPPEIEDGFADNGLVELLAVDDAGTFLALERSFTAGVGNNIRLYEINLQGATDISGVDSLLDENGEVIDVDTPVSKRLLLDFDDLGITLDNSEAVSFGEVLPDGRQSIIVTSDNNFNDAQQTQVLAFAIDTETIPTISPVVETPDEIRFSDPASPDPDNAADADDPAIYLDPDNPEESLVITTFKEGGLRVYNLAGEEVQTITPADIRYNNVDIAYGVEYQSQVAGETATVDLAIASDRANDTLAIFAINPDGGGDNGLPGSEILTDVTSINVPESIFGVDDGEATAYGLATYTSVVDGKNYVFVSQSDGNQIAQLEIQAGLGAADGLEVSAEVVRIFEVPVPEGEDPADFQVEGMVVDRETGELFVAQEEFGIWKFNAEPNTEAEPTLIDTVTEDTDLAQVPYSNLVVFGDSLSDAGN